MNIYIWPLLLLLGAIFFLILEVFIPSMGLLPLLCLGLFCASLWSAFSISLNTGLVFLAIDLAITPIIIFIGASIWPHTPLAKLFTLRPPGTDESLRERLEPDQKSELQRLVGSIGKTLTDLRPGGLVDLAGHPVDAVTDDGYIEAGKPIQVIGVRQSQILVRLQSNSVPRSHS